MKRRGSPGSGSVITSYSIHYTKLYEAATEAMTLDNASGAWSYSGDTSLVGKYYRYAIT